MHVDVVVRHAVCVTEKHCRVSAKGTYVFFGKTSLGCRPKLFQTFVGKFGLISNRLPKPIKECCPVNSCLPGYFQNIYGINLKC